MKTSELIEKYRDQIAEEMCKKYAAVIKSRGGVLYKIYVRDNGEIRALEAVSDASFLSSDDLNYVCTVSEPNYDPLSYYDEPVPEDEEKRAAIEEEIDEWMISEYDPSEIIDDVIREMKREKRYRDGFLVNEKQTPSKSL